MKLFVTIAVLMMSLLVGAALTVTISSRRASARYIDFTVLYDLAAAGNEQALLTLRGFDLYEIADKTYAAAAARRDYYVVAFGETFRVITSVRVALPGEAMLFTVCTRVHRVEPWTVRTKVHADIVLDGSTLTMVNSMRVTQWNYTDWCHTL